MIGNQFTSASSCLPEPCGATQQRSLHGAPMVVRARYPARYLVAALLLLLLCGPLAHARPLARTHDPKPLLRRLQQSDSSCWGNMACLDPSYTSSNLTADPSSLAGAPPLDTSAAGAIFSVFSTTSLTSTAALSVRGGGACPLLVLSGEQFGQLSDLASLGSDIHGLYPSDVGSAVKACANVAPVLSNNESYILGVAAWDMPKPTAGEPDAGKAEKQVSMLGSSMAICAAINPCDDAYVFGFDVSGPNVALCDHCRAWRGDTDSSLRFAPCQGPHTPVLHVHSR